jgi:XTP/dITP diphosphohydrolase
VIDHLVVATKNPDKIPEIEAILMAELPEVRIVRGAEFPDVEETGATLEENARLKAHSAARATGLPAIGDDTGLEVDALGGRPGVHTARFAGPDAGYADNRARLLAEMKGVDERTARFRTVVVLAEPAGAEIVAEGVVEGRITTLERGSGGFGYDPIFEVDGATLAEHGVDFKNRISHRARALQALATALRRADLP